jgi:autophagy-related protein 9
MRADQSPVEEETELEEQDLESGRRSGGSSSGTSRAAANTQSSSRGGGNDQGRKNTNVPWNGQAVGGSDMNPLRPNIKKDDEDKRADSSDDEVPQSFIIETPTARTNAVLHKAASLKAKGKAKAQSSDASAKPTPQRGQPLYSVPGRKVPPSGPILPVANVNIPPRPSELDVDEDYRVALAPSNSGESSGTGGARRPRATMRGLDAYERALWNWVNVYNLDAFLQEVYYYYEGKGIYSIALARGLNLL